MATKNAYDRFNEKYKTGAARRAALSSMTNAEIDKIARACPNKAGKAAIAAYKTKKK